MRETGNTGKRIGIFILFVLLFSIGAAACTSTASMENKTWVLESYGTKGNLEAVLDESEITATFDSESGKVTGSAGCNTYFAVYQVDGSRLLISEVGSTMMACEGIMEQEEQYLLLLRNAGTYQINGKQLLINCSGNQVLKFNVQ